MSGGLPALSVGDRARVVSVCHCLQQHKRRTLHGQIVNKRPLCLCVCPCPPGSRYPNPRTPARPRGARHSVARRTHTRQATRTEVGAARPGMGTMRGNEEGHSPHPCRCRVNPLSAKVAAAARWSRANGTQQHREAGPCRLDKSCVSFSSSRQDKVPLSHAMCCFAGPVWPTQGLNGRGSATRMPATRKERQLSQPRPTKLPTRHGADGATMQRRGRRC